MKSNQMSKEERQRRSEERAVLLRERERIAEEERLERIRIEDSKKKKISVDYNLFTHICKAGFLTDTLPSGKVDITFNRMDIEDMCRGKIVEKSYYGQGYQFLLLEMDRIDKIEILRRSPLFQQVAELL